MTSQQFFKGLLMAVVAVVVAAFSTQPIDFLLLVVTALCAILTYVGKNLISVLHSDSPVGALSLLNLFSGVLVALGTGVLESVGTFLINGVILWPVIWKIVLATTFTYLGGTFFAPPYNTDKVKFLVK